MIENHFYTKYLSFIWDLYSQFVGYFGSFNEFLYNKILLLFNKQLNFVLSIQDLRSKLQAAEQLCEELMDENEEYKKEIHLLEEEVEELQDNFREEQADEYRDLKRELEQRAKDCRVLQFKLKKSDRRVDTVSIYSSFYSILLFL